MVALTAEEIAVMRDEIAKGLLPPDAIEKYLEAEALNVFGHDARRDRDGNWIEQGIGSRGNETANHYAAILNYEGREAYEKAVAEIWGRDPRRAAAIGLPEWCET